MAKIQDHFTVVITPNRTWEPAKDICQRIVTAVRRHIDDVADASVDWDVVCSFCGSDWEEEERGDCNCPIGMPVCCEKAIEEWEAKKEAPDA